MLTWPIQWWSAMYYCEQYQTLSSTFIISTKNLWYYLILSCRRYRDRLRTRGPKRAGSCQKGEWIHNKTWAPQSFGSRPYRPTTRGEPPWSHALSVGWADRSMGMRYGFVAPNRHSPSVTNSIHQIPTRSPTLTEEPLVPIFPAFFCSLLSLSLSLTADTEFVLPRPLVKPEVRNFPLIWLPCTNSTCMFSLSWAFAPMGGILLHSYWRFFCGYLAW